MFRTLLKGKEDLREVGVLLRRGVEKGRRRRPHAQDVHRENTHAQGQPTGLPESGDGLSPTSFLGLSEGMGMALRQRTSRIQKPACWVRQRTQGRRNHRFIQSALCSLSCSLRSRDMLSIPPEQPSRRRGAEARSKGHRAQRRKPRAFAHTHAHTRAGAHSRMTPCPPWNGNAAVDRMGTPEATC